MFLAHKIRCYPTPEQHILFTKACGISRFVYNWALDQWKTQCESCCEFAVKKFNGRCVGTANVGLVTRVAQVGVQLPTLVHQIKKISKLKIF